MNTGTGGAIYAGIGGTVTLQGCKFTSNSATVRLSTVRVCVQNVL